MSDQKGLVGIEGWLFLPFLSIVYVVEKAIAKLYVPFYVFILEKGTFAIALRKTIDEGMIDATLFLGISNVVIIAISAYLFYCFNKKLSFVPKLFFGWFGVVLSLNAIVLLLETSQINNIYFNKVFMNTTITTLIFAVIVIPYMFISKRVKNTFVN